MRSFNQTLLIMTIAGLIGWYVASTLLTALTIQMQHILWMLN